MQLLRAWQMGAEELISIMGLDLTSRRRGLLSQMQYLSTVYDPHTQGTPPLHSVSVITIIVGRGHQHHGVRYSDPAPFLGLNDMMCRLHR
jgi:hypothetical protein